MIPFIWKNCKYPRCAEHWIGKTGPGLCHVTGNGSYLASFLKYLPHFIQWFFSVFKKSSAETRNSVLKGTVAWFNSYMVKKTAWWSLFCRLLSLDKHDCQIHLVYNYTLWMPIQYISKTVYPLVHTYSETYLKTKMLL